jgi:hypothetical protein
VFVRMRLSIQDDVDVENGVIDLVSTMRLISVPEADG